MTIRFDPTRYTPSKEKSGPDHTQSDLWMDGPDPCLTLILCCDDNYAFNIIIIIKRTLEWFTIIHASKAKLNMAKMNHIHRMPMIYIYRRFWCKNGSSIQMIQFCTEQENEVLQKERRLNACNSLLH